MKRKTNKLEVSVVSFENGIEFKIGKEKKTLSWKSVFDLKNTLSHHCDWYNDWFHYVSYYTDWNIKIIEEHLDSFEETEELNAMEYSLSDNYAMFTRSKSSNGLMCDNHDAAKILKTEYKKEFGIKSVKKLIFDPEMSYCYIYTKDKEEAKRFLWWVYKKYISPTLKNILNYK